MSEKKIVVFNNKEDMLSAFQARYSEICAEAVAKRNKFTVAFSGGKTPREFYRRLRDDSARISWDKTHVFMVDERCVPYDSEDSNCGILADVLLEHVGMPAINRHFIRTDINPDEAASEYHEAIKRCFSEFNSRIPRFDLIILGIGEDGHTASLFPGHPSLVQKDKFAVSARADKIPNLRVSMTFPVINNARNIIFLIEGKNKAAITKKILQDNSCSAPAAMVNTPEGVTYYFLDEDSASLLDKDKLVLKGA